MLNLDLLRILLEQGHIELSLVYVVLTLCMLSILELKQKCFTHNDDSHSGCL